MRPVSLVAVAGVAADLAAFAQAREDDDRSRGLQGAYGG